MDLWQDADGSHRPLGRVKVQSQQECIPMYISDFSHPLLRSSSNCRLVWAVVCALRVNDGELFTTGRQECLPHERNADIADVQFASELLG